MSIAQINGDLLKILLLDKKQQSSVNRRLDELFRLNGVLNIEKWHNRSNNKNTLLHELVEKDMPEVIDHLVTNHKLNINIQRVSDGMTPYQLAVEIDNKNMCDLLKNLGANVEKTEDVSKWRSEEDKEKATRIVWMDLEMTSIESPEILECAVIITDKDLDELDRRNWVIHFEQDVLSKLGEWHQKTFADVAEGGNGLFADVLRSKLTRTEVEDDLLALIKKYCPEKECPLAGSSIHIDKGVLKLEMPRVHDYLHYRIIDVTSFQSIIRRWAPKMETRMKRQLAEEGQETVNHRAMDDIKWSISFMKQFQSILLKQNNDVRNRRNEPPRMNHQRQRSVSPSIIVQNFPPNRFNQPGNKPRLYGDERHLLERLELDRHYSVKTLRLSMADQQIYDENPHLREVFINKEPLKMGSSPFTSEHRLLKLSSRRSSISNIDPKKSSTTEYWGQRKLLLTEIEFLTKNTSANGQYLVVYAGAGSGLHIPCLSALFPDLEFVLIDGCEFLIKPSSKIHIRAEKFTDSLAKTFFNVQRNVLFICNVRTFTPDGNVNDDILSDMKNQLIWHRAMRPAASLLNFRAPRAPGKTNYLKGNLIIEPWASHRTTECRLAVEREAQMIDYDNMDFAGALNHFQNDQRTRFYKHDMGEIENEGLDHCYDCQAEIFILQDYLIRIQQTRNDADLLKNVARMSTDISRRIEDKRRRSLTNVKRRLNVIPKKTMVVSSNV